jgi:acyl carrier protein
MTDGEILGKLRETMKRSSRESVDWSGVSPASTIESLGFDSLTILDLIYDIQQEFGVEFEAESLVGVKTVGELVAFLRKRLAPAG